MRQRTRTMRRKLPPQSTHLNFAPPKLCQVWSQDSFGRNFLSGYGFCHIPTTPGTFEIEIHCWRPKPQSWMELVSGFFLGAYPQLKNSDVAWRQDDRYRLSTVATGLVKLQLNVITMGFEKQGIQQPSDLTQ